MYCGNLTKEERDHTYQQCHTHEERNWSQLWKEQHFMGCHPGHKCYVGLDRVGAPVPVSFSQVVLLLLFLLFLLVSDRSEQSFRDRAMNRAWLWTSGYWHPWYRIQSPHTQRSGEMVSRTRVPLEPSAQPRPEPVMLRADNGLQPCPPPTRGLSDDCQDCPSFLNKVRNPGPAW